MVSAVGKNGNALCHGGHHIMPNFSILQAARSDVVEVARLLSMARWFMAS
jgi:hypothetical protein